MTPAPTPARTASSRRAPLTRAACWLERNTARLAVANLIAQAALIGTGGLVRLTQSGLGCSKAWYCEQGSLLPTGVPAGDVHPYIEFSNRVVVVFLSIVAGALAIAVWRARPDLRLLGLVPFAGVMVQAVLGAAVVNHQLPPLLVGLHMFISVYLVWASMALTLRILRASPRTSGPRVDALRWASLALFITLIVLGTLATGTGPHSGDDGVPRLHLDPTSVARLHSLSVWAFTTVIAAMAWLVLRRTPAPGEPAPRKALIVLLAAIVAQGAIGYIQYFSGRPIGWVEIHLIGIGVLTAAHSAVFHLTQRA